MRTYLEEAGTDTSTTGAPLDLGGTFVGPMHDRIHALLAATIEVTLDTSPTDGAVRSGERVAAEILTG